MKRRWMTLFASIVCVGSALACSFTNSTTKTTTTTTEYSTTGTFYPWRDRVYAFFSEIEFSTYDFVEARHYPDSENLEDYTVLLVDEAAVKAEIAGMFRSFDIRVMYPARNPKFAEYDLRFQNGADEILITLSEVRTDAWVVSFIVFHDGIEGDSQQYSEAAFPDDFDPLLSLLEGLVSL